MIVEDRGIGSSSMWLRLILGNAMPVDGRGEFSHATVSPLDGLAAVAAFGHGGAEGAEVLAHSLVDQHTWRYARR